jgi:hypothetical protein
MSKKPLVLFIAVGCIALTAGLVVGISDNPPGIILLYLASASFVLALAHRWRTVKSYVILLIASLVGFPVAAVLHNLLYALGEVAKEVAVVKTAAEALHVTFFLIAILLCPVGVLIGGAGGLFTWMRKRRALS